MVYGRRGRNREQLGQEMDAKKLLEEASQANGHRIKTVTCLSEEPYKHLPRSRTGTLGKTQWPCLLDGEAPVGVKSNARVTE